MRGTIMVRHVNDDFDALVMANSIELAGMTLISVVYAGDQFVLFARYSESDQIERADKIYHKERYGL
jgi:hypothetical protein